MPAAIALLGVLQIGDGPRNVRVIRRLASKLAQHRQAARADIGCRRIEQGAVIGKWNVVEVMIVVIRIEGAPAAVPALHAFDPLAAARNRLLMQGDLIGRQ